MSHFSHQDLVNKWNSYEQQKLRPFQKQKRALERFEFIGLLFSIGLVLSAIRAEKITQKATLLSSAAFVSIVVAYIDAKKEKKFQKGLKQIQRERALFFNQFRP